MKPLPMPVRIAAGLAATAVEQARELPRLAIEFPVTAVSQALQVSMRLQQRVTELAIKGDRVLGSLSPVEESPSWATFDDELDESPAPARNGRPVELYPTATELDSEDLRSEPEPGPEPEEPDTAAATAAAVTASAAAGDIAGTDTAETGTSPGGPNVMPTYPSMTLPQLRGKLRALSLDDLTSLLAWETTHEDRPAYVTMLSNRITTVTEA
ncbi:lipid droplet-associated protein [Pseudonocardia sp. T1-2H]|uniref:lipid droplet-associated protein n=1 Tax=Pseudonocardia sp. T1-2H TaxID=3128899 RepID=UPI003100D8C2